MVSSTCTIIDRRGYFNFEILNFQYLDGDVPRPPPYCVYISQLIRFARVCSNVTEFNNSNLLSFCNKAIDIIDYLKHFPNPIVDNPNFALVLTLIVKYFGCFKTSVARHISAIVLWRFSL